MIARARKSLAGEAECNAEPRAFVEQMIHAGLLQSLPASTRYHAPIPSMQDWLEHDRHIVPEIDLDCRQPTLIDSSARVRQGD